MKRMIYSVLLCLVFSIGTASPVFAGVSIELGAYELQKAGVPAEVMEKIPDAQKKLISQQLRGRNASYASSKGQNYYIDGNIQTRSLSEADIYLGVIIFNFFDSKNYVEEVLVSAYYEWKKPPIVKNIDIAALSWDAGLFQMTRKNGNMDFTTLSVYDCIPPGQTKYETYTDQQLTRPTKSGEGSVGWEYTLPRFASGMSYRNFLGGALIFFKPRQPIKKDSKYPTCAFEFSYAHNMNPFYPFHISFGVSNGVISANISGALVTSTAITAGYMSN